MKRVSPPARPCLARGCPRPGAAGRGLHCPGTLRSYILWPPSPLNTPDVPRQVSVPPHIQGGLSATLVLARPSHRPPPSAQCPLARHRTWQCRRPRPPSWMSPGNRHPLRARTGTSRATRYRTPKPGSWHRAGAQGHRVYWGDAGCHCRVMSSPGRRSVWCWVRGDAGCTGEMLGALGGAMRAVGEGILGRCRVSRGDAGCSREMPGVPSRC